MASYLQGSNSRCSGCGAPADVATESLTLCLRCGKDREKALGSAWADHQWWPLNIASSVAEPPILELELTAALAQLADKTIAVVGNATRNSLDHAAINRCDVVIRMNKGSKPGDRTDILTCGYIKPFAEVVPVPRPTLWWLKYTFKGAQHIHQFAEWLVAQKAPPLRMFAFTKEMEKGLVARLKKHAPGRGRVMPSTGLRVLDLITKKSKARSVTTFGINFWGLDGGSKISWTSGEGAHRHHCPRAEFNVFKNMRFTRQEEGQWYKSM